MRFNNGFSVLFCHEGAKSKGDDFAPLGLGGIFAYYYYY